jgi:2-polyprenyl-3-methyl-5-hydroxy-6-metoxy-1,4-benzoquinol methylase
MRRPGEWSWPDLNGFITEHVSKRFPDKQISILDVGAGGGKYRELFKDYPNMDAVEIWQEYIDDEKLEEKYRRVFCADIQNFEFEFYNLIVMGDVMEHLSREDALKLLGNILPKCDEVIISVPFMNEQSNAEFGINPHEAHLQADLNPELMEKEYPMLKELMSNHRMGVYIKR